mmetsp:Transcript_123259/g.218367  ORF Transcript_123259/g.218367 Transcript_123259/m.218367 type:complete len:281 (-) Transcript_123259:194-1036(-)
MAAATKVREGGEAEVVFSVQNGVATIRLNRPLKYNGWREVDTEAIRKYLAQCAEDDSIGAVILTGTGPYYTAGADTFSSLTLSRPSTMRAHITKYNQGIFDMFLDFPKPIIAAVNGPAVGVGTTSCTLMDYVLASTTATFHTPFVKLGLPPEGCSSFNFPRLLGEEKARIMLQDAKKIDAETALSFGLVHEVVEAQQLMGRAQAVAEEWIVQKRARKIVEQGLVQKLKQVNAEESIAFGSAITNKRFFDAQMALATEKGKGGLAWTWWAVGKVIPPLSRL